MSEIPRLRESGGALEKLLLAAADRDQLPPEVKAALLASSALSANGVAVGAGRMKAAVWGKWWAIGLLGTSAVVLFGSFGFRESNANKRSTASQSESSSSPVRSAMVSAERRIIDEVPADERRGSSETRPTTVGSSAASSAGSINHRGLTPIDHARETSTPRVEENQAPARALTLRDETESIDKVRALLRSGNASGALEQLERNQVNFPNGVLKEEALVLKMEALSRAGRGGEARAMAEDFLAVQPASPYAPRVRQVLHRTERQP